MQDSGDERKSNTSQTEERNTQKAAVRGMIYDFFKNSSVFLLGKKCK